MYTINYPFEWHESGAYAADFEVSIGYVIQEDGTPLARTVQVEVIKSGFGKHQTVYWVDASPELAARVLKFANGTGKKADELRERVLEDAGMYSEHEYAAERLGHAEYGLTERAV
jgi:hypothetical protein